jgi:hypothetical protein
VLGFTYTDKLVINLFSISDMKRCRRSHLHGIKDDDQETEGVSTHLHTRTGLQPNKSTCEPHMNVSSVKRGDVEHSSICSIREFIFFGDFMLRFVHIIDGLLKLIQAK